MAGVEEVKSVVGDLPFMSLERAEVMTGLIRDNAVHDVLELGFCHGVSTCYIAGALAELGDGHVVTIDRAIRVLNSPRVEQLLEQLSVRDRVTILYEYDSYNWRLAHFLGQEVKPEFDLIYIDGAHTWNTDGFAFMLAEQLLSPGGVIVFDDLHWSFASAGSTAELPLPMPPDEHDSEQVRLVFDMLVKSHPNITECWDDGRWGFARKAGNATNDRSARQAALALIRRQADETRDRAEAAVTSGEWSYRPWPDSTLPVVGPKERQFVAKLERDRQEMREFIEKLKRDRAWLMYKLGEAPRPRAEPEAHPPRHGS